jgi:hypothetical protein
MACNGTDFLFPLCADVYYPIVDQKAYGNIEKTWIIDKSVACNFSSAGSAGKEEVKPNVNITEGLVLVGRVKQDIRISRRDNVSAITNVIISNIKDKNGNHIYLETSGPRAGKSTIFEIATQEPFVGPFGGIEYYNIVLRRSENQAVNV